MKTHKKIPIIILTITVIFINSCQEAFSPDTITAEDNAKIENLLNDMFTLVSSTANEDSEQLRSQRIDSECTERQLDTLDDGVLKLTLTYDENGCETENGLIRKGQIITFFQRDWIQNKELSITTTFKDFYINDSKITGEIKIEYLGVEGLHPKYKQTATNMTISLPEEKQISWSGSREVKWLSGFLTRQNRNDDKIEINSSYTSNNRNGESYASKGENLIKDFSCEFPQIIAGKITIKKLDTEESELIIDFGNEECDADYTITQNGVTVTP